MTALAADAALIVHNEARLIRYAVADNVVIYKGSLVCLNTSGYAVAAADTASFVFIGIAEDHVDNTLTGHTAGGKTIRCRSDCVVDALTTSGASQATVGTKLYVSDSATVAGTTTNSIEVGRAVRYNSATSVDVYIPPCPVA